MFARLYLGRTWTPILNDDSPNPATVTQPQQHSQMSAIKRTSNSSSDRHVKRRCLETDALDANPSSSSDVSVSPRDALVSLSDELLLRILSFLSLPNLLGVSRVSRRLCRLSSDSQLWRQLYYIYFVLPRAIRIPSFRLNSSREGLASRHTVLRYGGTELRRSRAQDEDAFVDWKRQYKLSHNWSRGKCVVKELEVGGDKLSLDPKRRRTLAKVVDGIVVTVDATAGLRAWDLRSRELLSQFGLHCAHTTSDPTCMDMDDHHNGPQVEIAIGFMDGSFGIWLLDIARRKITKRYRHPKSGHGKLVSVAYSFPYLMTATSRVLVSLYAFDTGLVHESASEGKISRNSVVLTEMIDASLRKPVEAVMKKDAEGPGIKAIEDDAEHPGLSPPYLMTSLKSPSSTAPLALSIRNMLASTIAAISYTLPTREGWTIGIQELHISSSRTGLKAAPEICESRLAHSPPVFTGRRLRTTFCRSSPFLGSDTGNDDVDYSVQYGECSPIALRYTHPYLLATLPDNTLVLYLCTTNATALSVSRGIRLWGHTSGIGDVELTSRGKEVSVSCRGDELRVWELDGLSGDRSVEIRPNAADTGYAVPAAARYEWDDRRNWVGFNDEMVIVLKEASDGKESLVVYDFS